MSAYRTSTILAIGIIVAIFVVLAGVEAGMFTTDTARRCVMKFPKWFGCALANHEDLAGGLIGAGGALFAGWLAWNAALRQIVASQLPSLLETQGRTLRQVHALSYALDYINGIAERLTAIPAQDGAALVAALRRIEAEGGFAQPLMPQATREVGLRIEQIVGSLREAASRAGTQHLPLEAAAKAVRTRLHELGLIRHEIQYGLAVARAQTADLAVKISSGGGEIFNFEPFPAMESANDTYPD